MRNNAAKSLDLNPENETDNTRRVLKDEYQVDTRDITNSESLTYVILDLTVNKNYDRAIKELKEYLEYKSSFPTYRDRTFRLFEHIENVILAIRSKKNLMSFANVSVSKKKELHTAIVHHFHDLKISLQRVTQIEYQIRMKDSRSTLWVVNTFVLCAFVIMIFALMREAIAVLSGPVDVIGQDIVRFIAKYINI